MVLLDKVTKRYSRHLPPALDNVSLHVEPGEFVFIVGKSGAGKSTLIRMLTREEIQDSGKIIVGGIDYDDLKRKHIPHLRRRIGVVFQDFKLLPSRTVFENIAFALEIVGTKNSEIKRTVPKIIELVGLTGKENQFPDQLSGGERQRVSIARSVARQPKILIADEPTGNLDPETSREIMRLLLKINALGTTTLITTHDERIVNEIGKRVITISDGRIVVDQKDGGKYKIDRDPEVRRVLRPGHANTDPYLVKPQPKQTVVRRGINKI
jgi:cell division transport system ATP-binding protein